MDSFGFHPYPNRATDPLERGYAWPNAGFANVDRVKQALWDAFHGTPQPTTLEGLKLNLDEVGWQVGTGGRPGYTGLENVPVTDELMQAAIYGELIRLAACDPDIAQVSFFGFRDDGARTGFQAGLRRLDGSYRPAAEAVAHAIADTAGGCSRGEVRWQPGAEVLGARVDVRASSPRISVKVSAGEDARAFVCAGRPGKLRYALDTRCQRAAIAGLRAVDVSVPLPPVSRRVEVRVELRAEANRARRTHFVRKAFLRR